MGLSTVQMPMITKDDLLTTFAEVAEAHDCYFSKYVVATYVLYCCIRNAKEHDLAIASKMSMIRSSPPALC